jgi:FkbM family methyltransferase
MNYRTSPTCQVPGLSQIYLDTFGYKTDGSFVEVGAYDGISFSNTYGLARIGWRGLYVEAVWEYYLKCVETHKNHPRIEVINECVGDGNMVNMYVGKEFSTASERFALEASAYWGVKYSGVVSVPTMTLNNLLQAHWIGAMDLMVIDVEGSEADVLKGLSMTCWMPKLVIIEAHEQHRDLIFSENAIFINKYFEHYGYEKIFSDNCNNIYKRTK